MGPESRQTNDWDGSCLVISCCYVHLPNFSNTTTDSSKSIFLPDQGFSETLEMGHELIVARQEMDQKEQSVT